MIRLIFLLGLLPAFALANFEVPGFELVVTAPVDSGIQNEEIRGPVAVWKEMINGAKRRIDLGQMYASGAPGEPLDEILSRLEAAAKRGVKIRMLLEEKMARATVPETLERIRRIKGLELRVLPFGKISNDGIIHAKYIVVDGRVAFVGSQNFDWRALKHIHETGLRVTDARIVSQVQEIFEMDWKAWDYVQRGLRVPSPLRLTDEAPRNLRAYLVASPRNYLPDGVGDSEAELPRLIEEAKEEIRVQLLDYAPLRRDLSFYPVIDNALRAALARGVKIKFLVSHWNLEKPAVDHLKSLSLIPGIELRFARIPEAKEGHIPFARVNHSKFMTIDGKLAWVGTSNWSGGYLDKSRNLELVVKDQALARRLNVVHTQLWDAPYTEKLDPTREYEPPIKE